MRWNTKVTESFYMGADVMLQMLRHVVPPEDDQLVGLLGSSALLLLQEKDRIGPKWDSPSDFDVFVSGKRGYNDLTFERYTNQLVERIERLYGYITKVSDFRTYTRLRGRKVRVRDFALGPWQQKLSFIQCPGCADLDEVAAGFDIDVCRVIYHFHSNRFECSESVRAHIRNREAVVDGVVFDNKVIRKRDWRAVVRTMRRMRKYQLRGFNIINANRIRFE